MADRERRAYAWLNRLEWGWSTDKVARYARVSPRLVQKELARLEREIEAATAIRFNVCFQTRSLPRPGRRSIKIGLRWKRRRRINVYWRKKEPQSPSAPRAR